MWGQKPIGGHRGDAANVTDFPVLQKQNPAQGMGGVLGIKPLAMTYSCMDQCHTTIGV